MAQKKISIYITNEVIRICEVEKSGSNLLVSRVFETDTPHNSVEDGMIVDVEQVAEAIKAVFSENKIKKNKIVFSVYSRKIATKEVELPYVNNVARIAEMIASNVEDYFPMGNMQDYMIRHNIQEKVEVEGRKFYKIAVVAVQKDMVDSYFELGKALKMQVETVDYQVNSLNNLMKKQVRQGISLVLQVDEDTTHVTIMNGQTQLFRRSIPHGSNTLVQAFAADHRLDEEEALSILMDVRLMEDYLTPDEYTELIRDFAAAVTRVVEFYTTKNSELIIENAKMYGMGANLPGFGDALGYSLGIEIETLKHLNGILVKKRRGQALTDEKLAPYLPNIGAMIQSLNLKVEEEAVRKTGVGYGLMFALMGTVTAAAAGYFGFIYYEGTLLQDRKVQIEKQISVLQSAETVFQTYEQVNSHLTTLRTFAVNTFDNNEAVSTLITDLERIMPESMGLNSFSAVNGAISISASAAGKEPVALFIMALKELPYVSDVRVPSVRDVYDESGRVTSDFSMTFNIHVMVKSEDGSVMMFPDGHLYDDLLYMPEADTEEESIEEQPADVTEGGGQ